MRAVKQSDSHALGTCRAEVCFGGTARYLETTMLHLMDLQHYIIRDTQCTISFLCLCSTFLDAKSAILYANDSKVLVKTRFLVNLFVVKRLK